MNISKQEILKQWKPELRAFGFRFQKGMFWYGSHEWLQLNISIQRNLHQPTWKINVSIVIWSPFKQDAEPELLLMANLRSNGIYFHVAQSSWWTQEMLPAAFHSLKQKAIPWFEHYGKPEYLAQAFQTAILERKSVIDVVEPLDNPAPWMPNSSNAPPVPNRLFYFLSLLHYFTGNREKAIQRSEDWLNSLAPNEVRARQDALQQLSLLRQNT